MYKNILVTGGSGMVGKYLKNILPQATYLSSKDCDLRDSKRVDEFWGDTKPEVVIQYQCSDDVKKTQCKKIYRYT